MSLSQFLTEAVIAPHALKPSLELRRSILFFAHRYARPFYLGHLANDIGWSLERTEQHVSFLAAEGVLRRLVGTELVAHTSFLAAHVYAVAGSLSAQAGHHE